MYVRRRAHDERWPLACPSVERLSSARTEAEMFAVVALVCACGLAGAHPTRRSCMRREALYIADLVEGSRTVRGYLAGISRER